MFALQDSHSPTPWKLTSWSTVWARSQCSNASSARLLAVAKLIYAFTCRNYTLPTSPSSANAVATNTQIGTPTRCTQRLTKARNATDATFVLTPRYLSAISSLTCSFTLIRSRSLALSVSRLSDRSSFSNDTWICTIIPTMFQLRLKRKCTLARAVWKDSDIKGWVSWNSDSSWASLIRPSISELDTPYGRSWSRSQAGKVDQKRG